LPRDNNDFDHFVTELGLICDRICAAFPEGRDVEAIRLVVRRVRREGVALETAVHPGRGSTKHWAGRILYQLEDADREFPDRVAELEELVERRLKTSDRPRLG
jgi:hypothetical protein